jgi:copper resistance protein B
MRYVTAATLALLVSVVSPQGAFGQASAPSQPASGPHDRHDTDVPQPPDHAGHDGQGDTGEHGGHANHGGDAPRPEALPPHIPVLTDADRAAAFPDVHAHAGHDGGVHAFVLMDRLEWRHAADRASLGVKARSWIGGDLTRVWLRLDGRVEDGIVRSAGVDALVGRAISPWWDLVAGIRQDVRPGSPQTWAAFGVQGLAPYWFEVEVTGYLSTTGRTHLHVEGDHDLLLTNRLILQPQAGLDLHGRADPGRGIGAGLSEVEWGLRLRYEVRREFAPYVGVRWHRTLFGTRDLATADGHQPQGRRLTVGLRTWW